jgi:hypothetical protein
MKKRVMTVGPSEPISTCPFTGAPMQLEYNERLGQYRMKGDFWVSQWYESKQALLYDTSQRNGVPPGFARRTIVEVREREPPPSDPRVGLGASDALKESINEAVDRVVRSAGVG